ncbi:hypothetical protein NHQ30_000403 [Ciborinia camelliae]|nr:hypothetical protein NHQ30_000403 [Ciborinia camelliae]
MKNLLYVGGIFAILAGSVIAEDPKAIPHYSHYANEQTPWAPYLFRLGSINEFHAIKHSLVSKGPVHVYVNSGNQSVFLEGSAEGWGYETVTMRNAPGQVRPEILPGEVLVEGNTEFFWPEGRAYSRRDMVQMGCDQNGAHCTTEQFRYIHVDMYNLFEASYQPKNNGHSHAGGAHLDHSLVDGYTIPMIIVPDSEECLPMGCTEDPAGDMCPADHKIVIGQDEQRTYTTCASDCALYQTDAACCRNEYNHNECKASSIHFSNTCKGSYAYAYDDRKGLRFCNEVPNAIFHLYNPKVDCEWAVIDAGTGDLSGSSRACLNRLIYP